MSILPQDLITSILFLLPVESLLRFRCVSKSWLALIKEPHFTNMRIDTNKERRQILETRGRKGDQWVKEYYLVNVSNENGFVEPVKIIPRFNLSENTNPTSMLGCCNGLVCIQKRRSEIVIWNPSIKKHKKIPFEPLDDNHKHVLLDFDDPGFDNIGFGYDPVNNDFKVLKIVEFLERFTPIAVEVKIYSLKANSWKIVEDQWPCKKQFISLYPPAFTNGAFHWLADGGRGPNTILAFDLTTEKFGVQRLPLKTYCIRDFQVVGGLLCVCAYSEGAVLEVWIMKEYWVESSWSRLCKLPGACYLPLLVFSKDNKKVMMEDYYKGRNFWYDIQKGACKFFENGMYIPDKKWTTSYVESLFLLDGDSDN